MEKLFKKILWCFQKSVNDLSETCQYRPLPEHHNNYKKFRLKLYYRLLLVYTNKIYLIFYTLSIHFPISDATRFYLMYARFEEKYGLARQCVGVYDRAVSVVPEKEVLGMFRRYINVTRKFFGTIKTREVYERAIKAVSEKQIPALCLEYAEVEADLGEIDRARCLYNHCAQYVDPRSENTFWPSYHTFELTHGNQDTFQTMLQVRRSVESVFGSTIDMTDAIAEARAAREKFEEEKANAAKEKEGNSGAAAGSKKRKMVPNPEEDRMVFVPASATPPPDAENEEKAEQDENFDVCLFRGFGGCNEGGRRLQNVIRLECCTDLIEGENYFCYEFFFFSVSCVR